MEHMSHRTLSVLMRLRRLCKKVICVMSAPSAIVPVNGFCTHELAVLLVKGRR